MFCFILLCVSFSDLISLADFHLLFFSLVGIFAEQTCVGVDSGLFGGVCVCVQRMCIRLVFKIRVFNCVQ